MSAEGCTSEKDGILCGKGKIVEEKIKEIIADKLGVDIEEVVNKASLIDDLGADSLDIVELIMSIEEAFDIEVPDEDAEKLSTVKDAIEYIKSKL
jgi:acyl carrier protein